MSGLIVLFVMGYTVFMLFFLDQEINMIVYGILFFSTVYVWLSSFVSLQTTVDLLRMEDLELQTFTDYLTGVHNRRFIHLHLNEELLKAKNTILICQLYCLISIVFSGSTMSMVLRQVAKCWSKFVFWLTLIYDIPTYYPAIAVTHFS
jgi:GGDEF domain-containing protein